jgi:hypothetical protein
MLANPLPPAKRSAWDISAADVTRKHNVKYFCTYTMEQRVRREGVIGRASDALLSRYLQRKLHLKTTLILTKNTLIGQWTDEIKKFAPGLRVAVYHAGTEGNQRSQIQRGQLDLSTVDVLLCTWSTPMPTYLAQVATFHRTIVDE